MKFPSRAVASTVTAVGLITFFVVHPRSNSFGRTHDSSIGSPTPTAAAKSSGPFRVEPLRVSTMIVRTEPLAETVTATGTLRAEESIDLQAEVSGKIVSINFQEGHRVSRGDLLMKINDSELVAMLARAQARLDLARQREARFTKLVAAGGVNDQDFDAVRSEVAVQQAEVDLIAAQIAKTELRAPFDGIVGLRFVSEGAFITATSNNAVRVATLQSIDRLKIDFALPEKYVGRVRIGGALTFVVAGEERPYVGEIYAFEPRIDVNTRTVLIRAICPNVGAALVPGGFATLQIKLNETPNAVLVPAQAVIAGLNEKIVFVMQEGKAVRRAVQTGLRTEAAVQIVNGLKSGEIIVLSGLQQMRNGQPLQTDLAAASVSPEAGGGNFVGVGDASK